MNYKDLPDGIFIDIQCSVRVTFPLPFSNSAAIAAHLRYLAERIEKGLICPQVGTVILCDEQVINAFNLNGTSSEISESLCTMMAPMFAQLAEEQAKWKAEDEGLS